jgi:hypothetical protein
LGIYTSITLRIFGRCQQDSSKGDKTYDWAGIYTRPIKVVEGKGAI